MCLLVVYSVNCSSGWNISTYRMDCHEMSHRHLWSQEDESLWLFIFHQQLVDICTFEWNATTISWLIALTFGSDIHVPLWINSIVITWWSLNFQPSTIIRWKTEIQDKLQLRPNTCKHNDISFSFSCAFYLVLISKYWLA